ncbi:MAG: hypothetical protein Fur003_0180 [Candidatus Dojkabacteria bacterium]
MDISERQKNILLSIIDEYMKEAREVGSNELVRNYGFRVSPATIRNEMVKLMEMGYLSKSHASSGRLPTDLAMRLYINEKVRDGLLNSLQEIRIRQGIFRVRFDPDELIRSILEILVEQSESAAFMLMGSNSRHFGASSLMNYEELRSINLLQRVLDLLEDQNLLGNVFSRYQGEDVNVLIGNELGVRNLEQCAIVFVKFNFWRGQTGHMGVIGSRRMDYSTIIPALRIIRDSVESSLKGWK